MTLTCVQLKLVRFSVLYKFVAEQGGMSEEHILIVHSMDNQQSVWPAGIVNILLVVILQYSVTMFIHTLYCAARKLSPRSFFLATDFIRYLRDINKGEKISYLLS